MFFSFETADFIMAQDKARPGKRATRQRNTTTAKTNKDEETEQRKQEAAEQNRDPGNSTTTAPAANPKPSQTKDHSSTNEAKQKQAARNRIKQTKQLTELRITPIQPVSQPVRAHFG